MQELGRDSGELFVKIDKKESCDYDAKLNIVEYVKEKNKRPPDMAIT